MTPAARLAAAIDVLARLDAEPVAAERALADWGRAHRFAGSRDRAAIGDALHAMLRRRRSLSWGLGAHARAAAIGLAPDLFGAAPHAPPPLTEAERAALAARAAPPDPVRYDHPDWLEAPLRASLGEAYASAMTALQQRAPLDLRVNALRADRETAAALLAEDGIETAPAPLADTALRAAPGAPIRRSRAFLEGLVEPQDAASQAAALLVRPGPGAVVLDYCAGAGGKALALAATGARVLAHDAEPRRMRPLPERAARAGADVTRLDAAGLAALAGRCDLVFVDAPCSGSGSWRRDPLGKWRLTPDRLAALTALQPRILREAARFVRPGGALVYATCSILDEENDAAVERAGLEARPEARLRVVPGDAGDGFFAQALRF